MKTLCSLAGVSVVSLVLVLSACGGGAGEEVSDAVTVDTQDARADASIDTGGCTADAQCDDSNPCTMDKCVEGVCSNTPIECDDGLFCNGPETCDPETGQCVSGPAPNLDDGVLCTDDWCDEELDKVVHSPNDAGCDDGNPCTDEVCDPAVGGCTSSFNEAPCDDGDLCTQGDVCSGGLCAGTPIVCDDGLFCNGLETCDPATGECVEGEPVKVDDGIDCTVDSCDEDSDQVVNKPDDSFCDDGDPCTTNVCDPDQNGCVANYNEAECDDGNPCTVDDVCNNGVCSGTPKACSDGLFCNGEETCDPQSGECLEGAPPQVDDGIECTVDLCDEENDVVVNTPSNELCDDQNVCTDDICSIDAGGCLNLYNTLPCDDLDPCTVNDVCSEGSCAGSPKHCDDGQFCNGAESCDPVTGECLSGPPPVVDDSIDCTIDSCDEEKDVVVHQPDHSFCDDSNACTDDICSPQTGCEYEYNTLACDDSDPCTVDDVCSDGACAGTPKVCDDGLFCNGVESCDSMTGECVKGKPVNIDDGVDCTIDSCDEEEDTVIHKPDDAACDDNNVCTNDFCVPDKGCTHVNNNAPCDDGDECTANDTCSGGTCHSGPWVCETCDNQKDDNGDGKIDCCDPLCAESDWCAKETLCGNDYDDDCDDLPDCADKDCLGDDACGPYPEPGDLLITEIFKNPDKINDALGEWFEIYNTSQLTFNLRYMEVSDLKKDKFEVDVDLSIEPAQFLVFGCNADMSTNGGVPVDYQYDHNNFALSNKADQIILMMAGKVIDEVNYDAGITFPDPKGASMVLDPDKFDAAANDDGANWCVAHTPWGEGAEKGSPGAPNELCKEVECGDFEDNDLDGLVDCYDPDCEKSPDCMDSDNDGVADSQDVCPGGNDMVDEDQDELPDQCEITWAGDVWPNSGSEIDTKNNIFVYLQIYKAGLTDAKGPGPGIQATLLYKMESSQNYVEVAMNYNTDKGNNDEYMGLIPSSATIPGQKLMVEFKVVLDYGIEGITYLYNNVPIADQNKQSPISYIITTTEPTPEKGDLIITEIMKDPATVQDQKGEWFEVLNLTDKTLHLTGMIIRDDGSDFFTILTPVTIGPNKYFVFGNNDDEATNGGVTVDFAYKNFTLGQNEDEVVLIYGGEEIDRVAYNKTEFPKAHGKSMTLSTTAFSWDLNDAGSNWCEAVSPYGAGDLGTPGKENDPCL